MTTAVQLVLPVILPRAVILWGLIRLLLAVLPLAAGEPIGSMPPPPLGVICLAAAAGIIDVHVRGERILWANLAVKPVVLAALYTAPAILGEALLMIVVR